MGGNRSHLAMMLHEEVRHPHHQGRRAKPGVTRRVDTPEHSPSRAHPSLAPAPASGLGEAEALRLVPLSAGGRQRMPAPREHSTRTRHLLKTRAHWEPAGPPQELGSPSTGGAGGQAPAGAGAGAPFPEGQPAPRGAGRRATGRGVWGTHHSHLHPEREQSGQAGKSPTGRAPLYMPTGYISDWTPPGPLTWALGNE